MEYCGNCGAKLDGGKFCPHCGAPVSSGNSEEGKIKTEHIKRNSSNSKKVIAIGCIAVIAVAAAFFFFRNPIADEPCDWCGDRPSIAYETSDGSTSYVCKDCSSECALCGDKASRHYENLLGMIVFVCDDCYEEVQEYN